MDKLNDLQRLPVYFFDDVLELLHADSALVSLSQVNRDMNERVTPLIYSHTVIDLSPHLNLIRAEDIEEDDEDMDILLSFNLMSGLANNYRQQCRYVRKLTVRNGYTKASNNGTRWGPAGKGTYFDPSSLSIYSPWVRANMIFGMAIPRMSQLSKLVWTAEMPPTNQFFGCLPLSQLKSLVYRFSSDFFYHLKIEWPSGFTPGVRAIKKPSLSSLAITDIKSLEATDDVSSFLVDNMKSLKVLELRFLEEFALEDKLLNIVNPIIELQSQLRLHSLHLQDALSPGIPGWLEAFDFTSIRRFTLLEGNNFGITRCKELWNIFQHNGQRFESLITNCEDGGFAEFVESFQGLEQLMLCNPSRPRMRNFPKLNNHFDTLKCLFLPQDIPWAFPFPPIVEVIISLISNCKQLEQLCFTLEYKDQEQIFAMLSEFQNLKHLFFDRHDDLKCGDDVEPTPGSTVFINAFCDFCKNNSAGSAFLGRLELLGYYRTLWSIHTIGQIDAERESNQLEETDESAQGASYSEPPGTEVADRPNRVPVQIGWTDHLDDEMILAVHTWVVKSPWDGMIMWKKEEDYIYIKYMLDQFIC